MTRPVAAAVLLAVAWTLVVLFAVAAGAATPCPTTDRAAFRAYDAAVRAHAVDRQARDRVRQAVVRDYVACAVTR